MTYSSPYPDPYQWYPNDPNWTSPIPITQRPGDLQQANETARRKHDRHNAVLALSAAAVLYGWEQRQADRNAQAWAIAEGQRRREWEAEQVARQAAFDIEHGIRTPEQVQQDADALVQAQIKAAADAKAAAYQRKLDRVNANLAAERAHIAAVDARWNARRNFIKNLFNIKNLFKKSV